MNLDCSGLVLVRGGVNGLESGLRERRSAIVNAASLCCEELIEAVAALL